MDKLRENFFGISVGVLSLGLVALIYFLVVDPIFGQISSGGVAYSSISRDVDTLKSFADEKKKPQVPTAELVAQTKERQKQLKESLEQAKKVYETRKETFDTQFEEFLGTQTSPADFKSSYVTKINELRDAYVKAFPDAAPPAEEPRSGRRGIQQGLEVRYLDDIGKAEEVVRALHEFRMLEQVFKAAQELKLGGLRIIDFPERAKKVEGTPETYEAVHMQVVIDLGMAELGAFVSGVLDCKAAPMVLVKCAVAKPVEGLAKESVRQLNYGADDYDKQEAFRASWPGAAPRARATLDFWALDWKGLPKKVVAPPKPGTKTPPEKKK